MYPAVIIDEKSSFNLQRRILLKTGYATVPACTPELRRTGTVKYYAGVDSAV
jgi:hypothetical protein